MSEVQELKLLPEELIRSCRSLTDAIFLSMYCSDWKGGHNQWAERLGISKSYLSEMKTGKKHFPPDMIETVMRLSGNLAPQQFLALKTNVKLETESLSERVKRLEAELAKRAA